MTLFFARSRDDIENVSHTNGIFRGKLAQFCLSPLSNNSYTLFLSENFRQTICKTPIYGFALEFSDRFKLSFIPSHVFSFSLFLFLLLLTLNVTHKCFHFIQPFCFCFSYFFLFFGKLITAVLLLLCVCVLLFSPFLRTLLCWGFFFVLVFLSHIKNMCKNNEYRMREIKERQCKMPLFPLIFFPFVLCRRCRRRCGSVLLVFFYFFFIFIDTNWVLKLIDMFFTRLACHWVYLLSLDMDVAG